MSLTPGERLLLERRVARRRRPGTAWVSALALLVAALPLGVVAAAGAGVALVYSALAAELEVGLEHVHNLADRETFESIKIYDRNGVLLREIFTEGRRTPVPLTEIPLTVRQATIAVEDASFYQNPGIDVSAIGRAAAQRALQGRIVSGGSTITQQFVRHVAFSDEERLSQSYARKSKEIVLAVVMTRRFSKNDILEGYLNEIYFGNLAYGIEAAAQTVFGKSARDLDLAESALLAGLPQAPLAYDPLSPEPDVRDMVKARQRTVLNLMARSGFITGAEADAAAKQKLTFVDPAENIFLAPHFVVYVEKVLEDWLGPERLARGGLKVVTTLDLGLQSAAERIVRSHVDELAERHHLTNASVVAVEPRTGQILAMVGSKDYWDDDIDGRVNVAIRMRQPGSSIKPIAYATALEQGLPTSTLLWDVPMKRYTPELYEPRNYDERFRGPVGLRAALANSYNIPALKLLEQVGVREMILTANRMGIESLDPDSDRYGLSVTLGGGDVTLLEMVTAFGVLANGGGKVAPHPVLKITDSVGNTVYDRGADTAAWAEVPAIDPGAAYIVTDILSDNAARSPAFGSRSPLLLPVRAAAKTGTTNDVKDNWTVGYTPYVVVGVWAGNNDNSEMRDTSGITGAAPIWHDVMLQVVEEPAGQALVRAARSEFGVPFEDRWERPANVVERPMCILTSLNNLGTSCTEFRTELFVAFDGAPDETASGEQPESGEGAPQDPFAALSAPSHDVWVTVPAAVVPMPEPPPPVEGEEPQPWPSAQLCMPAGPGYGLEKSSVVAVLPLPEHEEDRMAVIEWAASNGWVAIEPTQVCTPQMAEAALDLGGLAGWAGIGPGGFAPSRAEYRLGIEPGTVLTSTTALTGTVMYNPEEIEYYKVELGAGAEPTEWITLGDIHHGFTTGGTLEILDTGALPPGPYVVRLVLVKRDGNFLVPPHSVPIRIGR